ncbi:MAG: S41 family peptidase [Firmicutes bacterium]|nr:S41 family peptidase [Bacillota bacterium]
MRPRHLRLIVAGLLVLVFAAGALLARQSPEETGPASRDSLGSVLEIIALLRTYHVEDVDSLALVRAYLQTGTIDGMLREALDDDYTRYLNPQAYVRFQEDQVEGSFGGIGIMVGIRDERLTIISPIPGTPGLRAGLRGGDLIVGIDGRPTEHMSLEEAVSLMRGPEGERVVLTIVRDGETHEVEIIRDRIEVQSVQKVEVITPEQAPVLRAPVGYIHLSSFNEATAGQFDEAVRELADAGIQGLLLDLRYNPGGLLHAALDVADRFLDSGPMVHVVDGDGQRNTYSASPGALVPPVPVVVLVNQFSASGAEILAGALRDNDRAVLVGETTFGKGSVQSVVPLRGGAALSLTTAYYETAGGHFIHKKGIVPDVVVENPEDEAGEAYLRLEQEGIDLTDPQLRRALEVLDDLMEVPSAEAA